MVLDVLSQLGWEVEVAYTKGHGDATPRPSQPLKKVVTRSSPPVATEPSTKLPRLCVARGLFSAYCPCGSGNGLARHLGIPVDLKEGLKVIIENHAMEIDYATVNDCKFLHLRSRLRCGSERGFRKKKTRGKLTYIQSTFQTYASYEPEHYTIMATGKTLTERAFLVAVCNASQYGNNAYIAPSASINDGLLLMSPSSTQAIPHCQPPLSE